MTIDTDNIGQRPSLVERYAEIPMRYAHSHQTTMFSQISENTETFVVEIEYLFTGVISV